MRNRNEKFRAQRTTTTRERGECQSRRELEETIEQQKEQITNYEKKTRDLVRAYKGLVKEKEALEKSLVILNTKTTMSEVLTTTTTDPRVSSPQSDSAMGGSDTSQTQPNDSSFSDEKEENFESYGENEDVEYEA